MHDPERIDPLISTALESAEQATGTNAAMLTAIAWRESRFGTAAQNRQSSARGLMQFTRTTWLAAVRDYGAQHGLAHLASALRTDRHGTISARNGRVLAEILRLRDDPQLAAMMTAETIAHERAPLEQTLGRAATPADLYFVHLLGAAGARSFLTELRRAPSRSSVAVVGRGRACPNAGVFLARSGRALTLAEVYAQVEHMLDERQHLAQAGRPAETTGS